LVPYCGRAYFALPFVLETKVIILEHESNDIHERALTLFATKAKRAVGARGELSIRITSSAEMRELNRRFRRKNKPTDVLSFPSDTPKLAGDIAISAEIAAANADELGHSVDTELKILILHGLLHLMGYDHETDAGEMQTRETKLRQRLNLPVGLIERANGKPPSRRRRTATSASRRSSRR
jgi:probable rRNA maturation factor